MLGDGVLRALLPIMEPGDDGSSRPRTGRSTTGAPYCERHISRDVTAKMPNRRKVVIDAKSSYLTRFCKRRNNQINRRL